jgi:hypothetical protein
MMFISESAKKSHLHKHAVINQPDISIGQVFRNCLNFENLYAGGIIYG